MQNKSQEKEFFDKWSEVNEYDVLTPYGYDTIIKNFLKLIGNNRLVKNLSVIDLGCSSGVFTRRFLGNIKAKGFGLDISFNSIKLATQKKDGIKYLVGDIENLNLKSDSFDVVIFSGVLHHFNDSLPSLKEGYRILKKGGCMVSFDPNAKNPFMWLYRHPKSPFFSQTGKTTNEKLISGKELKITLEEAGFGNVSAHCISGVTFKYIESNFGRLFLPLYNAMEFILGKLPLSKAFGSFVIGYGEKL